MAAPQPPPDHGNGNSSARGPQTALIYKPVTTQAVKIPLRAWGWPKTYPTLSAQRQFNTNPSQCRSNWRHNIAPDPMGGDQSAGLK